jgi:hypothetical protein
MHWIKWLLEGWIFLGITTTILTILWTNKQSRELNAPNTASPPRLRTTEFRAKELSEARSA